LPELPEPGSGAVSRPQSFLLAIGLGLLIYFGSHGGLLAFNAGVFKYPGNVVKAGCFSAINKAGHGMLESDITPGLGALE